MHAELARDHRERGALLVPRGSAGDRLVVHLADHAPSGNAGLVELVDDGGPVHLVPTSERVNRCALAVPVDQLFDFNSGEPSLHRV